MKTYSRKEIVISEIYLREVLADRYTPGNGRAVKFIQGFRRHMTPQGDSYWTSRYYKMYSEDIPNSGLTGAEMSYEDWAYIESLVTPVDSFLTDPAHREYISG